MTLGGCFAAASARAAEGQGVPAVCAAYLGAQPRCLRGPAACAAPPSRSRGRSGTGRLSGGGAAAARPRPRPVRGGVTACGRRCPGRGRRAMASSVVRATVRAVSKRRIQATRAALTLVSAAGGQRGGRGDRGTSRVRELRHGQ